MNSHRIIVEAATALASSLPTSTIETVAAAILSTGISSLKAEITKRIPHHQHRDRALSFIDCWQYEAPDLDKSVVAIALQTAALSEQKHRDSQTVELVWTGPDDGDIPFRRTEQAILQLLDSAQEMITLVSFAVYSIPNIAKALVKAAQRGVKLTVIVETPDKLGGENEYSTLRALGTQVEACSSVYYWPKEKRKLSEKNKPGILHVKCAVADGEWLFLSSANLTQQAFTINMELGMLVRGGTMPSRVEQQFKQLVENKQLQLVKE
jgi:phosphatidylserine/phosphatidylglycerophosphate/cardiolipin synthase-like enzyme